MLRSIPAKTERLLETAIFASRWLLAPAVDAGTKTVADARAGKARA